VYIISKSLTGIAAAAALGAVLFTGTAQQAYAQATPQAGAAAAAQPEKKPKDTAEYDLIRAVMGEAQTQPQKAIADLNTWTQKYPQTEFADERTFFYLQAYSAANQPDKVLEYGAQLLGKDLNAIFKSQQGYILETLYRTAGALTSIKAPTAAQMEAGTKAANQLKQFIPAYFIPANKPPAAADKDWAGAKDTIEGIANQALLYAVVVPADQAAAKNDFKSAEAGYKAALQKFPENGQLAYTLSTTILKEKDPSKYSDALYFMARALALDPAKGGIADANSRKQIEDYLKKQYTAVHGSDEGLADLMKSAAASAMPPAGFKIKTGSEIALEKENEFKEKYPELALWMSIKGALSAQDGESYFKENMLGGVEIKNLKGQVMEATPECNPKELKVGIPEPEQKSTLVAEITLKLENPVKGKPAIGQPIKFDAVPAAFAKEPFMLTMDVDADKVPELQVEACTPAKATGKKGAAPKSAPPAGKKAAPKK
jgi:hypothetical protein